MSKDENHNVLESMKEAIIQDQHLYDRVMQIIRNVRSTTGQSLGDYMKGKEDDDKSVSEKRNKKLAGK